MTFRRDAGIGVAEHDPETWMPVFPKSHAPSNNLDPARFNLMGLGLERYELRRSAVQEPEQAVVRQEPLPLLAASWPEPMARVSPWLTRRGPRRRRRLCR